jgi:hypothetical protein
MKSTIDMAREAGIDDPKSDWMFWNAMERFADLVRADAIAGEREACAKVCEDNALSSQYGERSKYRELLAAVIRTRGNA